MSKTGTVVTGMAALATVAVLGACGNSGTREATSSAPSSSNHTSTSASAEALAHNQADMNFASAMIPHHQQAVEMSDIILAKQGIDPRVVNLATQIKAAQGPEIQQMQGWMTQWGMPMSGMPAMSGMAGMDHGGMHGSEPGGSMGDTSGMEGMMSQADMDALKNAQGVEAATLYLTGMIKHHQSALTMAQNEIKDGQFPAAVALAKSILATQQAEIDTMNQILGSL